MTRASKNICKNNMLVLFLVILLTILIVYIALNSYNKEMFSSLSLNNQSKEGNILFHTTLLNTDLQSEVDKLNSQKSVKDNNVLSQRHLTQVLETRRPELIAKNPSSPEALCYINLHK